ncbi:MAG: helix-turn-helix domain-containing protein [Emergencia sp.]
MRCRLSDSDKLCKTLDCGVDDILDFVD